MSTKMGDKLDEIYAAHQVNIENELQQMIKRFKGGVNGESNETSMRSFFDSLSQRWVCDEQKFMNESIFLHFFSNKK